tara:strand:- start:36293 stop:36823 length:531 start_codon:yes stop_codon:yes gene_type:complete
MTANSYSKALYELSVEAGILKVIENQAKNLLEYINKIDEFKKFIKSPVSKQDDHLNIIDVVSKTLKFNTLFEKFLKFLSSKRRLFYLDKILKDFLSFCSLNRGELDAKIISSKELSKEEIEVIKKDLSQNFKSNINLNYEIDKSLIVGIKIQVGSIMIDNSLKTKLKKIHKQLIEV